MPEHRDTTQSRFVIVSSEGMHEVAASVQKLLEVEHDTKLSHHHINYTTFANKEVCPKVSETVRRQHVLFFHPLQFPTPNDALMRLALSCDALTRASVESITLILPYIAYLRQDRKDQPRVPISSRVVADLIQTSLVRHIVTMDMHTEQAEGVFRISVDNMSSRQLFATEVRKLLGPQYADAIVVAPDFGSAKRAKKFADELDGLPVALIEKNRTGPNACEVVKIIGESVEGRCVLLYDDMIDTGGTIMNAAAALLAPPHHAKSAYVLCTRGILSGSALETLRATQIPVLITNTIPRSVEFLKENPFISVVPVDMLLSNVLYEHMLRGGSVSKLKW
jgi:ribose-phosphate pyrophosphokinase